MSSIGRDGDGDDEETARFSSARDEEEVGAGSLVLLCPVQEVEEEADVEVVTPVCSAKLEGGHGAPATAALPCLLSVESEKKRGQRGEREKTAVERRERRG